MFVIETEVSCTFKNMHGNGRGKKGSKLLRKGRLSWVGPRYFIGSAIAQGARNIDNQLCFSVICNELARLEQEETLFCEALVVMSDHLHMLIRLGSQKKIGQAMKLFKGRTAREINRQRNSTGALWFEGYHDHMLRPDEPVSYFLNYITLNPVKKGLCISPSDYPYLFVKTENE